MSSTTTDSPMLKLDTELWKTRAAAKQQWLDNALAQPVRNSRDKERRLMWIKRALEAVKRAQDEIRYQTALVDAYAEHLTVLEMKLIQATERPNGAPV